VNRAFVEQFKKEYNRTPQMFALYGYAAGRLIEKAFEKAGSFDKERFVSALEGMVIDSRWVSSKCAPATTSFSCPCSSA